MCPGVGGPGVLGVWGVTGLSVAGLVTLPPALAASFAVEAAAFPHVAGSFHHTEVGGLDCHPWAQCRQDLDGQASFA